MEQKSKPTVAQMIRAPFFSSILAPLFAGTVAAVIVNGDFYLVNFILVLVMGLGLHTATNVYNDIYDTFQGTDKVNVHRNEFSGGSGILVDFPELLPKMFFLARIGLIVALAATIGLLFFIKQGLYIHLVSLYLLAAFFSKYYTAAPVKLAYKGWGEISVWFAFGPMAVAVAAVSQNVGLDPVILLLMPLTGLSTFSILWVGQMIDLEADTQTGKLGLVSRIGTKTASLVYPSIQLILVTNIIILPFVLQSINFWVYLPLIPYTLFLPKAIKIVLKKHADPKKLPEVAKLNVLIHLLFSLLLTIGLVIQIL